MNLHVCFHMKACGRCFDVCTHPFVCSLEEYAVVSLQILIIPLFSPNMLP